MSTTDDNPHRPDPNHLRPANGNDRLGEGRSSEGGEQAPTYDTEKKDYRGISTGALDHIEDVRDARAFAEMIVDTVREGLLVLDLNLRVVAANESFYQTFEVAPDDTVGHLVYDLGNEQWDIAELRELLEDILPRKKVFDDFEVDHVFENLGRRQMLLNARQLDDHELILLAIEDVTERRKAGRDLRESEEQYRALFESIEEGFCIFEMLFDEDERPADYRFLKTNPAFERHTGLTDAAGKTARELVPDLEDHWLETYGRIATTGESEHFVMESGAMGRWFEVDAFRVGEPEERKVALLFTDVSEQRRAAQALRELNEHLEERVRERTREVRDLSRRLTRAEQEERRRLSQILHDDLQQFLYGVDMRLVMMRRGLQAALSPQLAEDLKEILEDDFHEVRSWIEKAITTTRQLTVDLSPLILEKEGLTGTLEWLQRQMKDLHDLEVTVEAEHAFHIEDEDLRVLLFQIVRELLFNVKKHAGVDEAFVRLTEQNGHAVIHVNDEGTGFDAEQVRASEKADGGFGLVSIRERLGLIGGHLEISSAPGEGTHIEVYLPPESASPENISLS